MKAVIYVDQHRRYYDSLGGLDEQEPDTSKVAPELDSQ